MIFFKFNCFIIFLFLLILVNGAKGEAYNISNRSSVVNILQMAEAFAHSASKEVLFENASEKEKASFNMMDNSSLNAEKLEQLGWSAVFDMDTGAEHTLNILTE